LRELAERFRAIEAIEAAEREHQQLGFEEAA
jgi:hypothetical protein